MLEALRAEGQTLVEAAAERALGAGIKAETSVLLEPDRRIADVILEAGVHWSAELIVLGTHGRHGLGHLFLGSVSEEVIRASTVPVLTVRQ
jgi:nucleotide-binding universal stress UspA family protein